MKYRISAFYVRKKPQNDLPLRARRPTRHICPLPPVQSTDRGQFGESIDIDLLFELSSLTAPKRTRKKILRPLMGRIRGTLAALCCRTKEKFKLRLAKKCQPRLSFFCGVLCSAILWAAISAGVIIFGLFGRFMFFSNDSAPNDTSRPDEQYPITRFYTVEDMRGMTESASALLLKNQSIPIRRVYEYSDTESRGIVISTSPSHGERLYEGQQMTLTVSLGKKTVSVKMPSLTGLSEAAAKSLLEERGLVAGTVTYKPSAAPAGEVIEQQFPPYTALEAEATVDIVISLGTVSQKKVPDLFGMTAEEARKALAAVGLVLGGIFAADSGAPSGTVISQTPAPMTPITSSITSVDIYISS